MKTALFLVTFVLGACASAPVGVQITIAPDRIEQCRQSGGCALLSGTELAALMNEGYALGQKHLKDAMDSHGCMRGRT